jgi:hypothetical protein
MRENGSSDAGAAGQLISQPLGCAMRGSLIALLRSRSTLAWVIGLAAAWTIARAWPPVALSQPGRVIGQAAVGGLLGGFICGMGVFAAFGRRERGGRHRLLVALLTGGAWSFAIATYSALAWGAIYRLGYGPLPLECVSPTPLFLAGLCGGSLGALICDIAVLPVIPGATELPPGRWALALSLGSVLGYAALLIGDALLRLPLLWFVPIEVGTPTLFALSGALAGGVTSLLSPPLREAPS